MLEKTRGNFDGLQGKDINSSAFRKFIDKAERYHALEINRKDIGYQILGVSDISEVSETGIVVFRPPELRVNPGNALETYEIPFSQISSVQFFQGQAGRDLL